MVRSDFPDRRWPDVTAAEQRYADLLPVGIIHCDEAGICRFANRRAWQLLGDDGAGPAAGGVPDVPVGGRPAISWTEWLQRDERPVAAGAWAQARSAGVVYTARHRLAASPACGIEVTLAAHPGGGFVGTLAPPSTTVGPGRNGAERAPPPAMSGASARLLSAVGHDLRQPLHAAGLFLGVLALSDPAPRQRELMDLIEQSLKTLEDMLSGLVELSKLEAGAIRPGREPTSLPALLQGLQADFDPVARSKNLRFVVRPRRCAIYTDPQLLSRLVANLISNAIRFTDAGGVLIGCRRRGNRIRIEVWDTGCGIPSDQWERIFDPFYRLEGYRPESRDRRPDPGSAHRQGLGLGLAVVDRLSRLLGHPVGLRSRPGRGSVFAVDVPLAAPAPGRRS